jgi:hypothetical protein
MDHSTALKGVIDAISVLATNTSDDDVVALLQKRGYSRMDAEKLSVFVPSALSWIVLKRLGVATLPNHFIAYNHEGVKVEVPVSSQHYFTAALSMAYSTFKNGWSEALPRNIYDAVTARSAEMNIVNRVFAQGGSLEGSSLEPLELLRISAEEVLQD